MGTSRSQINMKKGFTLIELLVVISIIGVLSSVVLASVTQARDAAREARAKQEIREIRNAIIIAQGEQGGRPLFTFANYANCVACGCTGGYTTSQCTENWEMALQQIQTATKGLVSGLERFARDPWGNPYNMDANQYEGSNPAACGSVDTIEVFGRTISGLPTIPLAPNCP